MSKETNNLAIYIHWPFCKSKCPYCDFNSHVREQINQQDFIDAYTKEISHFADFLSGKKISSIYFGGGTPTLAPMKFFESTLNNLNKYLIISDNIEITVEGNPTSIESQTFKDLQKVGVNRVSLGIQALNDNDLKFLGREHSVHEALNALHIAASTFENYSFDIIYARPKQTLKEWEDELERAIALTNGHLSLYQLTIEKGTKFFTSFKNGDFALPDDNLSADMYQLTNEITKANNISSYEVSNYASPGKESRHNMAYWEYEQYLGLGAGAHSRIKLDGKMHSLIMQHNPEKWLDSINNTGIALQEKLSLSNEDEAREYILMGLRIKKGINKNDFQLKIGKKIEECVNKAKLTQYINSGLVEMTDENLKTTEEGTMLLNSIISGLLDI